MAEEAALPVVADLLFDTGGVALSAEAVAGGLAAEGSSALGIGEGIFNTATGAYTAGAAAGAAGAGILESLKSAATVLSPVASLVSAASGVSSANKMSRVAPNVPGQLAMPIAGSPVATQAQQNSFVSQLQRRGRASTILTSPDGDKLGN